MTGDEEWKPKPSKFQDIVPRYMNVEPNKNKGNNGVGIMDKIKAKTYIDSSIVHFIYQFAVIYGCYMVFVQISIALRMRI